jgi:CoA:oxalate CoA-transferase
MFKVDIALDGLSSGYLASRRLGFETLQVSNIGLILSAISPVSQTGPDTRLPAYDIIVAPR